MVVSCVDARSIFSFPVEIRKRNYVRLSTEMCDECMTLESFYAGNPLGFVLFFEHSLMGGHRYKEAIVSGWMEVCKELRWSRIACGLVDMVTDRAYAERYIDPKTAPAHIMVRDGQPLMALKHQVDPLLKKPGDKQTMLNHVADLLKDHDGAMGNLTLSIQVENREAFQSVLEKHKVVIASFVHEDQRFADSFRAGVQEAVLGSEGLQTSVGGPPWMTSSDGGRRGKGASKALERSRVAFVAVKSAGVAGHYQQEVPGSITAFIGGLPQTGLGAEQMSEKVKPGAEEVAKAVRRLTATAMDMASHADDADVKRNDKGSKSDEL